MYSISGLLADMLESGRYSDLTIKCSGKVFKVHRNVVCLQSKPLAAHVDGGFAEAITGEINLPGDHPQTLERLIKFLYTGNFDAIPSADEAANEISYATTEELSSDLAEEVSRKAAEGHSGILITCTRVFIMAEKYDIPDLKNLAKTKFEGAISTEWNTCALSVSLRLMYDELPESDRLIKDVAIEAAASHVKELTDRGEFAALCRENGDIALDVLKACSNLLADHGGNCTCYGAQHATYGSYSRSNQYCRNCGSYFS
ncbi:uncharacterized protein PAC_19661 [Phialocephala subalpina]|uniref:BTB domain-containing protein n=1 Tax=Phialocephala subalpina TaxID=576137 RepID=A0A1L7XXG7_9HELO|nr:uncharacterized protein PAC_19661 [Phialocephala subalpina]